MTKIDTPVVPFHRKTVLGVAVAPPIGALDSGGSGTLSITPVWPGVSAPVWAMDSGPEKLSPRRAATTISEFGSVGTRYENDDAVALESSATAIAAPLENRT